MLDKEVLTVLSLVGDDGRGGWWRRYAEALQGMTLPPFGGVHGHTRSIRHVRITVKIRGHSNLVLARITSSRTCSCPRRCTDSPAFGPSDWPVATGVAAGASSAGTGFAVRAIYAVGKPCCTAFAGTADVPWWS